MKAQKGFRLPAGQQKADAARREAHAAIVTSTTPEAAEAEMIAAFRQALALAIDAARQQRALLNADFGPVAPATRPTVLDVRQTNHMQTEADAAKLRAREAFDRAVLVTVGHAPPAELQPPSLLIQLMDAVWPFQHFFTLIRETSHDDEVLLEAEGNRRGCRELKVADFRVLNAAAGAINCPQRREAVDV